MPSVSTLKQFNSPGANRTNCPKLGGLQQALWNSGTEGRAGLILPGGSEGGLSPHLSQPLAAPTSLDLWPHPSSLCLGLHTAFPPTYGSQIFPPSFPCNT